MPVDKFGRMSDLKTKDTGVSLTYINNNYVRSDGETPLTGSLDMRGNTIYNVADPVNPQDVVTKVYVDNTKGSGVIGRKIGDAVSIKENLNFLGKQKIKNLPDPVNDHDAVTKEYVDSKGNFLELDNPFKFKDNIYEAKDNINLKGFKISEVSLPSEDGDVATKKYVDDLQTQNVDEKGNIKFSRNINLDRNRIFSMKEPTKPSEGANKKYVDDTITKRLQEEKDNFLPQDPATKEYVDEAIKGLAGGDLLVSKEGVFIKANGHYRATAPLDIDNHKMENLPDPVDDKDAVNKKYIDEIVENLTLKQGLIRENGGFNLVDSYINMNFNNIRNVGLPKDESDAVPRRFVDEMIKEVEEKVKKVKEKSEERPFFKENGNYQALFSINMGFNRLLNLHKPTEPHEATTKEYVDVYFDETKENVENYKKETKKEVEEFIDTTKKDIELFKEVTRQQLSINEDIIQERVLNFKQIINVAAEYRGAINRNEIFYFSFFNHSINSNESFTMPMDGRIIKIKSHVKRTTLGEGVINETPIGFDVENKVLKFSLRVNGEERHIIFNPTQSSTTLSNPIVLQPDNKITLYTKSNEPIRISAFIVLVIELNI